MRYIQIEALGANGTIRDRRLGEACFVVAIWGICPSAAISADAIMT